MTHERSEMKTSKPQGHYDLLVMTQEYSVSFTDRGIGAKVSAPSHSHSVPAVGSTSGTYGTSHRIVSSLENTAQSNVDLR